MVFFFPFGCAIERETEMQRDFVSSFEDGWFVVDFEWGPWGSYQR